MSNIYTTFNEELNKRYSIDYGDVWRVYESIGNLCGVYPDTALLLMSMVTNLNIKKVVELGSGASTLFIARACKQSGASFMSYEETDKYLDMSQRLLGSFGLPRDIVRKSPDVIDFTGCDMVFLDSSRDQRTSILRKSDTILGVPLVILDDAGALNLSSAFSSFIRRKDFDMPIYVYNGVGRGDRHQMIGWDPDVYGNLDETIYNLMPRIC